MLRMFEGFLCILQFGFEIDGILDLGFCAHKSLMQVFMRIKLDLGFCAH